MQSPQLSASLFIGDWTSILMRQVVTQCTPPMIRFNDAFRSGTEELHIIRIRMPRELDAQAGRTGARTQEGGQHIGEEQHGRLLLMIHWYLPGYLGTAPIGMSSLPPSNTKAQPYFTSQEDQGLLPTKSRPSVAAGIRDDEVITVERVQCTMPPSHCVFGVCWKEQLE